MVAVAGVDVEAEIVEQPVRWENVTARAVLKSLEFIESHAHEEKPFFLYHAFTKVHIPPVELRAFSRTN